MSNNGKPFPPQYGRFTRMSSNQKITANRNSGSLRPVSVGHTGNNHIVAACLKQSNAKEVEGAKVSESKMKMGDNCRSEHKLLLKDIPQISLMSQDVGKAVQQKCLDIPGIQNHVVKNSDLKEASECKPGNNVSDGKNIAQTISVEAVAVGNGTRDCLKSSSGGLDSVAWVGNLPQIVDGYAYYESCQVNGIVYKLQDHALFCCDNGKLRPSKIQALWVDTKTGSRWALVNSCFFPAELPEVVGRPCPPENNVIYGSTDLLLKQLQVYESNHCSLVSAGSIQGPCYVLPPTKFKEAIESGGRLNGTTNEMRPIFVCKGFIEVDFQGSSSVQAFKIHHLFR